MPVLVRQDVAEVAVVVGGRPPARIGIQDHVAVVGELVVRQDRGAGETAPGDAHVAARGSASAAPRRTVIRDLDVGQSGQIAPALEHLADQVLAVLERAEASGECGVHVVGCRADAQADLVGDGHPVRHDRPTDLQRLALRAAAIEVPARRQLVRQPAVHAAIEPHVDQALSDLGDEGRICILGEAHRDGQASRQVGALDSVGLGVVVAPCAACMLRALRLGRDGTQAGSHRTSEQGERNSNLRGAVLHDAGFSVGALNGFRHF